MSADTVSRRSTRIIAASNICQTHIRPKHAIAPSVLKHDRHGLTCEDNCGIKHIPVLAEVLVGPFAQDSQQHFGQENAEEDLVRLHPRFSECSDML